jgi:hypothetical protein
MHTVGGGPGTGGTERTSSPPKCSVFCHSHEEVCFGVFAACPFFGRSDGLNFFSEPLLKTENQCLAQVRPNIIYIYLPCTPNQYSAEGSSSGSIDWFSVA